MTHEGGCVSDYGYAAEAITFLMFSWEFELYLVTRFQITSKLIKID
jgi:hypothetical protein